MYYGTDAGNGWQYMSQAILTDANPTNVAATDKFAFYANYSKTGASNQSGFENASISVLEIISGGTLATYAGVDTQMQV